MWTLLAALLAVGPVLDPIEGEALVASDRDLFATGGHVGAVLDHFFVPVVSMQSGGAGLALFDRLYLSSHGRSWSQQRFLLNGVDISDPANPGSPLVELPHRAWDALQTRSLWTDRPGISFWVDSAPVETSVRAEVRGGAYSGGGVWLPRNVFDREPATDWDAPTQRRALNSELLLRADARLGASASRAYAEHLARTQVYPTTLVGADGEPLVERAERSTAMFASTTEVGAVPLRFVAVWQRRARDHEGAAFRFPEELTGKSQQNAVVAQVSSEARPWNDWHLHAAAGFGAASSSFLRNSSAPIVVGIEREWMWLQRPRRSEDLFRLRTDFELGAEHRLRFGDVDAGVLALVLRAHWASMTTRPGDDALVNGRLWDRSPTSQAGVSMTVLEAGRASEAWLGGTVARTEWRWAPGDAELRVVAGLDVAAAGAAGGGRYESVAPAVGAALRLPLGASEFLVTVRREPDRLTAEVATYLDAQRDNGIEYLWNDDGDRVPNESERGALLRRTGGRYHDVGSDLRRPSSNQFQLGWRSPRFGAFRAVLTGAGRWHLDRYAVRYDDATARSFREVEGVYGDTPGVLSEKTTPQQVYARDLSAAGNERYVLVNDRRPNFWLGSEIQLVSEGDRWWFLNLSAAGYWNIGRAPFGAFPDRNDPGVIDEVSADPNARLNGYGRFDQDRSFGINALLGARPWQRLSLTMALRYRDGQPFSKIAVASGLPQGSTPIMIHWRGRVRHTFHMWADVRLQYVHPLAAADGLRIRAALDALNLFGSGTELVEDPRAGDEYRRPLEMVPGRTLMASVELGWN